METLRHLKLSQSETPTYRSGRLRRGSSVLDKRGRGSEKWNYAERNYRT